MLYRMLRALAAVALRWYYRSIEVVGLENVPAAGPVIVAANHWNALIDALVIACALERPVRLTAKATLLAHPITRVIVHAVGIIPLRRASDEPIPGKQPGPQAHDAGDVATRGRNAQAFDAMMDALERHEVVLIFPEGKSHSGPALTQLKTGCARLALMAHAERRLPPVPIVPIGLTFEAKGQPRSRVVVQIGPPIVPEADADVSAAGVQALTARIDVALRDITLNFASDDDAARVLHVSAVLARVLDRVRPLDAPDPPLSAAARMARRIEAARLSLPHASPDTLRDVESFLERLEAFRARLRQLHIPVNDLSMPVTRTSGIWFVLREVAILTATFPLAAWGRLNHWIPLALARRIGRATSTNADEPAMRTLVAGIAAVLAFYVTVATCIAWNVGLPWAFGYVATLPPTASLDFWLTARFKRAIERASAYLTLRADPVRRAELRREAGALRHMARMLDASLR